jgi:cation transport ATPase
MKAKFLLLLILFVLPVEVESVPLSPPIPSTTHSSAEILPIKPAKKKKKLKKRRKRPKNSSDNRLHWSSIYLIIVLLISIMSILWLRNLWTGLMLMFPILWGIQIFVTPFLFIPIKKGMTKNKYVQNVNIISLIVLSIMCVGVGIFLFSAIVNPLLLGAFSVDMVLYLLGFELIMFGGMMIILLIFMFLKVKPSKYKASLSFIKLFDVYIGLALFFLPILFGLATSIFYSVGAVLLTWIVYWFVCRMKAEL